ncbi:MAG TPA: glutamine--fructose-6-phosphate transaminase (isomerizing) [Anaerolineales bacterium]|nr:glutamine--fructose-6-phosphate transaminase (isomerizing) [Anaerolineales bacterium]
MCGIVGYVGPREAAPIIFDGLKRLEYRGYDSSGLAVMRDGQVQVRREVGKLDGLASLLEEEPVSGSIGIGHTRWATHGAPSRRNAHPHLSATGEVVVVHNGIVENFLQLRDELSAEGVQFSSDTDTEVIAHLVERYMSAGQSLEGAAQSAFNRLKGAHGIVVISNREPDKIVCARIGNAGGVTLGLGEGEMFIASDMPAILHHTRKMVYLESRQIAVVTREGYRVSTLNGAPVKPEVHTIPFDAVAAEKGEYKHFMQKEIFEQARAVTDTLRGRADFERGAVSLADLNLTPEAARSIQKIVTVACGTSYYSGLVGRHYFETIARLPAQAEIGSEFRYSDPIIDARTVVLAITQSGETVDTLAAMEEAREKQSKVWAIVNVAGSEARRVAQGHISMQAGPEIGVASTKAFTTSIVDQYLLACYLGQLRGTLSEGQLRQLVNDLARLPDLMGRTLDRDPQVKALAEALFECRHALYLGRGIEMPIALEGALKLKEISYIHAEGYPAGEMKHGPIALIDREMPVVALCLKDAVYDKMLSQVEQAKARGGRVIAIATDGDELLATKADHVLYVPDAPPLLQPVISVIPLQLLAYHIAVRRGTDVDQPRNLAKSVTVE